MLLRYINEALERAHYEIIEEERPHYGEIPDLHGLTFAECRRNLAEVLEDWLLSGIAKSLSIPPIGK